MFRPSLRPANQPYHFALHPIHCPFRINFWDITVGPASNGEWGKPRRRIDKSLIDIYILTRLQLLVTICSIPIFVDDVFVLIKMSILWWEKSSSTFISMSCPIEIKALTLIEIEIKERCTLRIMMYNSTILWYLLYIRVCM